MDGLVDLRKYPYFVSRFTYQTFVIDSGYTAEMYPVVGNIVIINVQVFTLTPILAPLQGEANPRPRKQHLESSIIYERMTWYS